MILDRGSVDITVKSMSMIYDHMADYMLLKYLENVRRFHVNFVQGNQCNSVFFKTSLYIIISYLPPTNICVGEGNCSKFL